MGVLCFADASAYFLVGLGCSGRLDEQRAPAPPLGERAGGIREPFTWSTGLPSAGEAASWRSSAILVLSASTSSSALFLKWA
jgi:hypothetical protein